jgi:hypothetical protein
MTDNTTTTSPTMYVFDGALEGWRPAFPGEPIQLIDGGARPATPRSDGSLSDPNFRRFTVMMELQVTAGSVAEADERAMLWRDSVSGDATAYPSPLSLPFDWHLHHPIGC